MQKKKELIVRITNESGKDLSIELARLVARMYLDGELKINPKTVQTLA